MKIIIDIPEETYNFIKENSSGSTAHEAIKNGMPLPKGPGRLIAAQELRDRMYHEAFETDTEYQRWDSGCWIRYKMFEEIEETEPTIIEADKEADT